MELARAHEIIAKRARQLEAKKATNARYKASHPDTFLKRQCGYQKKHYNKTKQDLIDANIATGIIPIVKVNPYILPEVNEVIIKDSVPSYIVNKSKKGVSPDNVAKYINIINNVHHTYTDKTLDDDILTRVFNGSYTKTDETYIAKNIDYITTKKIDTFIEYLKTKYINTNTLRNYLMPYIIITSYINKYKPSYLKLSKINIQCNNVYTDIRSLNLLIDTEKIISFNPLAIDKILNDASNFPDAKYKLIYAIYTLIVPRRAEIGSIILTDNLNIDELNDENYLVIDKNGYKLVFNKYKTANKFGKQIVDVPTQLKQIIDVYCKDFKIVVDTPLFPNKNVPISNATMGTLVSKVFSSIFNTKLTINDIRISASTYHDSLNLSLADDKAFAIKMCHSYITDKEYVKKVC